MHCSKASLILWASLACASDFSGNSALEFAGKAVAFGPRPSGSPAIHKLQTYIETRARSMPCELIRDTFAAVTPHGPIGMENIIFRFPGTSGRAIVITGHYDTKPMPGVTFLGANDGGSSTGVLLELARALSNTAHPDDIYLVFFDGEEAVEQWSETDSLYGSRHLASKWAADGTLSKICAMINVDMIGDKDLGILLEGNSSPSLRTLVWQTAGNLGYGKYFLNAGFPIDDDHMPFVNRGVNALDLIDFDYGSNNQNWHTDKDTMDKLSARSLAVVGRVLIGVIHELEK